MTAPDDPRTVMLRFALGMAEDVLARLEANPTVWRPEVDTPVERRPEQQLGELRGVLGVLARAAHFHLRHWCDS